MIFYPIRALSNLFPRAMTPSLPVDCPFTQPSCLDVYFFFFFFFLLPPFSLLSSFPSYNWTLSHGKSLSCCLQTTSAWGHFPNFQNFVQHFFHNNFKNILRRYIPFITLCNSEYVPWVCSPHGISVIPFSS